MNSSATSWGNLFFLNIIFGMVILVLVVVEHFLWNDGKTPERVMEKFRGSFSGNCGKLACGKPLWGQ